MLKNYKKHSNDTARTESIHFELPETINFTPDQSEIEDNRSNDSDVDNIQINLSKIIVQNKNLKDDIKKKDQAIQSEKYKLAEAHQKYDLLRKGLQSSETENRKQADLNLTLQLNLKKIVQDNNHLKKQFERDVESLETDLCFQRQEMEKLNLILKSELNSKIELQQINQNQILEIRQIKMDFDSSKAEVTSLELQKTQLINKISDIECENAVLQNTIEEYEKEIQHWKSKFSISQTDLNHAQQNFNQEKTFLNHTLQEKTRQTDTVISSLKEFYEGQLQNIKFRMYEDSGKLEQITDELEQADEQIRQTEQRNANLEIQLAREHAELCLQIKTLSHQLSIKDIELSKIPQMAEEFKTNEEKLQLQIAGLGNELLEKNTELEKVKSELHNLENKNLNINSNLSAAIEEHSRLVGQMSETKQTLQNRDEQINGLQIQIEKLTTSISDTEIEHAKKMSQMNSDKAIELSNLTLLKGDLEAQLIRSYALVKKLTHERTELANKIKQFNDQDLLRVHEYRKLEFQFETLSQQISEAKTDQEDVIEQFENELKQARVSLELSNSENAELCRQKENLLLINSNLNLELKFKTEEIEQRKSQLNAGQNQTKTQLSAMNAQVHQLNGFVAKINAEKASLRSTIQKVGNELHYFKKLNPLVQILKVTEEQILKIELQLMKTPVISFERPQLEKYLESLVEQKSFLKNNIDSIDQSSNIQLQSLNRLLQNDLNLNLPPLPELFICEN